MDDVIPSPTRRWVTLLLAPALFACSGGEDTGNNSAAGDNTTAAKPQPIRPVAMPTPAATPSPQPITELPTTMRGRWAQGEFDCDPRYANATGAMDVSSTTLTFFDSRATLDVASVSAPDRVSVQLNFVGRRGHWTRREALTLLDNGQTLVREEQKPEGAFTYHRC